MSYVIRNCPCLEQSDLDKDIYNSCLGATDYIGMCQDCTDCVLKRIVEVCGKYHVIDIGFQKTAINYLSSDILQLLDIQEVE